jgi:hypothetical protein
VRKLTGLVKDEEEKRSKAVSLLKTVRQKLVKAEKDREDTLKEMAIMKDKEKEEREKEQAERLKLVAQIGQLKSEKDSAVANVKNQLDREIALLKDRHDKELNAMKGQFELEAKTAKASICKLILFRTVKKSNYI